LQTGATFSLNLGWEAIPASGNDQQFLAEIAPIATIDWDRPRNKLYFVSPDKLTITGESNNDTDIYVRTSSNAGATWSSQVLVNDNVGAVNTTASQFHPRLAVDQQSSNVVVCWYDCRKDSLNKKTHFYAAVSLDGFANPQPRNFQLNALQSDGSTVWGPNGYKDYVGLTALKGFLYPVWLDNSNSTSNNPDGTAKFDVYTCRVAY
jgi:hypothetical protein